jgi:group I intron endonuclease
MYNITGENHPIFGKNHSIISKAKMNIIKGTAIYVYDTQGSLVNIFYSARNAAEYFNSHHQTIMKYVRNGEIFKEQWILSISLITKE